MSAVGRRTFSCTERIGYCILGANTRAQLPHRHHGPPRRQPRVIKIYSLESKNKFCLVPRSSSFGLPSCSRSSRRLRGGGACAFFIFFAELHSFCAASITHFVASSQFCSAAAARHSPPPRSLTTFYWHDLYPNSLSHTTERRHFARATREHARAGAV